MSSTPPYRGRFAPSPTGPLHLGSLLVALGSWLLAKNAGGQWWVRVEDLDPPREIRGAARDQLQTLAGFGLVADAPVTWQSDRWSDYQAAVDRLLDDGSAFHCHCSRSDLASTGGIHRRCTPSKRRADPAIRLRVPASTQIAFTDALQGKCVQDVARQVGDFVLKRADGCWAYQLAVVVDDAAQGMTDIVRGADLLDSTARQILLQRALGLPTPRYLHLPVIVDAQGRKLSKSAGALAADGADPLPVLRKAWQALGQSTSTLQGHDGAAMLHNALAAFDPALLLRCASIPVAALHNEADANAV